MGVAGLRTFPPYQHWTVAGFRITIAFYKRDSPGYCAVCNVFPARHHAWADGRGSRAGFSGNQATFCDEHRPEKGTLPPLDYLRLVRGGMTGPLIHERLEPWPGQSCAECGQPAVYRAEYRCEGCSDRARRYVTRLTTIRAEGVTDYPAESHHQLHPTGREYRCSDHPLEVVA